MTQTPDITQESIERFIAQYIDGAHGCDMNDEDAQSFAMGLQALLARLAEVEAERDAVLSDMMAAQGQIADAQAAIARIEELEANINLKADFIDATINQLAASDQRIEELEAKLRQAIKDNERTDRVWGDNYAAIEAKLAKAMSALRDHSIARCFGSGEVMGQGLSTSLMGREILARMENARTTLEELEQKP